MNGAPINRNEAEKVQAHGQSAAPPTPWLLVLLHFITSTVSFNLIFIIYSSYSFINLLLITSLSNVLHSFPSSGSSLKKEILEFASLYLFCSFNCVFNDQEKIV